MTVNQSSLELYIKISKLYAQSMIHGQITSWSPSMVSAAPFPALNSGQSSKAATAWMTTSLAVAPALSAATAVSRTSARFRWISRCVSTAGQLLLQPPWRITDQLRDCDIAGFRASGTYDGGCRRHQILSSSFNPPWRSCHESILINVRRLNS